jgi:pimeloyl-ACP methyl ester carboxylesterase
MSLDRSGDLTYLDQGVRDGEVVVLLNGWPTSSFLWRRLVPMLAARFRVLAPDLVRGDLREQVDAVRRLLSEHRVERFAAVGHSHGGGVAQLLALDDVGVGALVLLDSIAFDVAPPTDLEPTAFIERGAVEFASLTDDEVAGYLAVPRDPPRIAGILEGHEDAMASWTFPVLIFWGEDDPFTPLTLGERLSDAIPASTLGVVPDSGHFLLDDAFESVAPLLVEWLRARYLGAPHGHEGVEEVVTLQLERRASWTALGDVEADGDEASAADPDEQEVGPNA